MAEPTQIKLVLPGLHDAADNESLRGQTTYLRLSKARLIALLVAAIAGAFAAVDLCFDYQGLLIVLGFFVAAVAEGLLIFEQPERNWYAGRAVAESTKTLVWRFAVKAEPFHEGSDEDAITELQERMAEVVEKGADQLDLGADWKTTTSSMLELRNSSFETRQHSYLEQRTKDQQTWYAGKAKYNAKRAKWWRRALFAGETVAFGVAVIVFMGDGEIDFAGAVAAAMAAGAAWIAMKQYSQLTSAYRVAATELALQQSSLENVHEEEWASAAANAEEAISREHTMWLASRGVEPLTTK